MAQRKRIALIFKVDKAWMGGTYYVLNLINALGTLPEDEKPEILLLCRNDDDFDYAFNYTQYPLIEKRILKERRHLHLMKRILNKLWRIITGHSLVAYDSFNEKVDVIYPVLNRFQIASRSPKLYWIPDFQEHFMPFLFTEEKIRFRDRQVKEIIDTHSNVVFSSQDSKDSFYRFYPKGDTIRTHVLHFASKLSKLTEKEVSSIMKTYNVPEKFLYCANQFWVHKNHKTLFEAIKKLKDKGKEVVLYCSGSASDFRNSDYYPSLLHYIEDNCLTDNIKILGLIDRKDQIALMTQCTAIVQPSLFEGWNTSVEEAKSLNKLLVLSDLDVHKEQVKDNVIFFSKTDSDDLARAIEKVYDTPPTIIRNNYDDFIRNVGKDFMEIINSINPDSINSSLKN